MGADDKRTAERHPILHERVEWTGVFLSLSLSLSRALSPLSLCVHKGPTVQTDVMHVTAAVQLMSVLNFTRASQRFQSRTHTHACIHTVTV